MREEAETREEVEHGVETPAPFFRQRSHVAALVPDMRAAAARVRVLQKVGGIVEAGDVEARFRKQVGMPSLPARHVEQPRIRGQFEHVEDPRHVAPVPLRSEDRLVLEQVLRVEVPTPPLRQKNTGSRYAPNTLSSAARISYSVQYERAQSRMNGTRFALPAAAVRRAAMFRSQRAPSRVMRSFASAAA